MLAAAEALLDHAWVYTALQGDRGPGMAKAVEWDVWQGVAPQRSLERLIDPLGMQGSPIGLAEGQAVVHETVTDEQTPLDHLLPVLTNDRHRHRVQSDRATAGGRLGLTEVNLPTDRRHRLRDAQPRGVEVDVVPP